VRRRLLLIPVVASLVCAAPVAFAPSAHACPIGHNADPFTGQCYVVGGVPTVNGIPCIPGRSVGTCLGFLQNKPLPGGGAPPGGPWP
jgi:hypothetical protein